MPINLIRLLIICLGLPHSMDTVISWSGNKRTYFFKDKSYWKLDDHSLKLNEGYPRDITQIWMNLDCSKRSYCRDGGKTCEQGKHRSPSPSPPTPSLPFFVFPTFWLCATTIYYLVLVKCWKVEKLKKDEERKKRKEKRVNKKIRWESAFVWGQITDCRQRKLDLKECYSYIRAICLRYLLLLVLLLVSV